MSVIEYYFNNLDANTFQRLINGILVNRFGENIRLTPRFGSDGGKDGETAASNPNYEFQIDNNQVSLKEFTTPPQKGRYFFQVKHHRTIDTRVSDARSAVISDFERELKNNVLNRHEEERINFFFLVTNVRSSERSIAEIDKRQKELRKSYPYLYADVWWGERVEALLDQMPQLWTSFPSLFAGGKVPFLAQVSFQGNKGLPRAIRLAIERQFQRDSIIKFRQIDLEKQLHRLFTGLDISIQHLTTEDQRKLMTNIHLSFLKYELASNYTISDEEAVIGEQAFHLIEAAFLRSPGNFDALNILLDENTDVTHKIILEGGPGQGKSTLTQMVIQIYRQQLLNKKDMDPEGRWSPPGKSRLPLRIELRLFAEWLTKGNGDSIEEYLAFTISRDSAGSTVVVDDIHNMVENTPIMLVLDGLDEVGNDTVRNDVLTKIAECIYRFEDNLGADMRVIITTRPPTVSNCKEYLIDFKRFPIAPMSSSRIKNYVQRWLSVQLQDEDDRKDIGESFEKRQNEPHVQALSKNPMQLSVLLHFIRLKGAAFPDRRAELYREYFRTVIDRDVEKSASLREQREIIEALHQFLGYKIHGLTETNQADGTLSRSQLLQLVKIWLQSRGNISNTAEELFKLGEERLGLIVALKGEGEETRYGYEIQPIREYFAAAFINDDIEGNAHEVFQNMVRRPYWREVSLFLAGLRRPNEKADLIARAKNLDNEEKLGWRQDGRNLTLQLLQEGVFSQPPHVFADALDYLFDLFDPRFARFQNEPKDLSKILPDLIIQDPSTKKRYNDRLQRLIQEFNTSEDEYTLFRLYRIASKLLEAEKVREYILSYQGHNLDLLAKLRLKWPLEWNINLDNAIQSSSFWAGIPDSIWGLRLWQVINNPQQPKKLHLPSRFHQVLAEQFAIDNSPLLFTTPLLQIAHSNSVWAIMLLVNYSKLFSLSQVPLEGPIREKLANLVLLNKDIEADFVGLDEETQCIISDLLTTSFPFLKAICLEKGEITAALNDHLLVLHKYMQQPGLTSWMASKWAMNIVNAPITQYSLDSECQETLQLLWGDLNKFYPDANLSAEQTKASQLYYRRMHFLNPNPSNILFNNGELVKVTELLARAIYERKDFPFSWLSRMPITSSMIRSLIEKSENNLEDLLSYLGNMPLVQVAGDKSLRASHMQRVLKIVREKNNPFILKGALVALGSSKFLRLAGTELCLKMLQADTSAGTFTQTMFRKGNEEVTAEEREIINEIAKGIMDSPNNYAFRVNTIAANYLAESAPIILPPLLSLEEELKIHIYSNKARN